MRVAELSRGMLVGQSLGLLRVVVEAPRFWSVSDRVSFWDGAFQSNYSIKTISLSFRKFGRVCKIDYRVESQNMTDEVRRLAFVESLVQCSQTTGTDLVSPNLTVYSSTGELLNGPDLGYSPPERFSP